MKLYAWIENDLIFAVDDEKFIPNEYKDKYYEFDNIPIQYFSLFLYIENNEIKQKDINEVLRPIKEKKLLELKKQYYDIMFEITEINSKNLPYTEIIKLRNSLDNWYKQNQEIIMNSNNIDELQKLTFIFNK